MTAEQQINELWNIIFNPPPPPTAEPTAPEKSEAPTYADALDPSKPDAISTNPVDNSFQNTINSAVKLSDNWSGYISPAPPMPVAQKPLIDLPKFAMFSISAFLIFKILKRRK